MESFFHTLKTERDDATDLEVPLVIGFVGVETQPMYRLDR
jgi:hypothetical protein